MSVTSLICISVSICPVQGVNVGVEAAFYVVRGSSALFLSYQSSTSYARGGSLVSDRHHLAAAWEGNVLPDTVVRGAGLGLGRGSDVR